MRALPADTISVTVKEAAQLIGCSEWTTYALLNSGAIEGRYIGKRKRLVLYSSLKAYIEGLPVDAPESA